MHGRGLETHQVVVRRHHDAQHARSAGKRTSLDQTISDEGPVHVPRNTRKYVPAGGEGLAPIVCVVSVHRQTRHHRYHDQRHCCRGWYSACMSNSARGHFT